MIRDDVKRLGPLVWCRQTNKTASSPPLGPSRGLTTQTTAREKLTHTVYTDRRKGKTFKVGLWQGGHEHDGERERGERRGWVCRKAKIHVSNIWNTSPRARGEREVPGRPAAEHQRRLREERGQEGGTEEREAGTHTPTSLASPFCSAVVISAINWLYATGPLQWLHIEKQRVNMRILRSITLNQLSAG